MLNYIKSLISADTKDRMIAFLAFIAGIALCLGFVTTILCLGWRDKLGSTDLFTITAGLIALATFSKVDKDKPKEE